MNYTGILTLCFFALMLLFAFALLQAQPGFSAIANHNGMNALDSIRALLH